MLGSSLLGGLSVVIGLWVARVNALPPGGTIVLVVVGAVVLTATGSQLFGRLRAKKI